MQFQLKNIQSFELKNLLEEQSRCGVGVNDHHRFEMFWICDTVIHQFDQHGCEPRKVTFQLHFLFEIRKIV